MSEPQAFLTLPHWRYKRSYIAGVREFIREGQTVTWHPGILAQRFDEFLEVIRQAETEPLAGFVPATQYWLVSEGGAYLGDVDIRHRLNASLRLFGGHIGYRIRPSQRRKGYGSLILGLGIEQARKRHIGDILVTCDEDNIGSAKVIENNGGVLLDRIDNGRGVLTRRYWIYGEPSTCMAQRSASQAGGLPNQRENR